MGSRIAVVFSAFALLIGLFIAVLLGALVVTLNTPVATSQNIVDIYPTVAPQPPAELVLIPTTEPTLKDGMYSTEPLTFAEQSYMSRVLNYLQISQSGFSLMAGDGMYGSSSVISGANSVISAYNTMEIAVPPARFEVFHRKMLDAHASCPVAAQLIAESANLGYLPRSASVKLIECEQGIDEFTAYLNDVIEWLEDYL